MRSSVPRPAAASSLRPTAPRAPAAARASPRAFASSTVFMFASADSNAAAIVLAVAWMLLAIPGVLQLGVLRRRITHRESSTVKAAFGRHGWRQIPFTAGDLIAVLREPDDAMRESDFAGLVSTNRVFDIRIAAFIVKLAL